MKIQYIYSIFCSCCGITTDSRNIKKDDLFIALKGGNFNGNEYAAEALRKGAKYVIIDEKKFHIDNKTILVDDCLTTLQELANYHRKQFTIPFIGITGTNGKTTTAVLLNHILEFAKHRT